MHVKDYIKILIWSLQNITKNGIISIYVGLSVEPSIRDLIILLSHFSKSFVYSLNYFYGLDNLSSSFVFYDFKNVDKLINELKYVLKL